MLATVPGGPKTSYVRCLGLKGAVLLILVSAYEGRFSEPKMPCSRDTVNPPAPITSSTTSGIHSRLRTPKIVNPFHLSTLGATSAARPCNYTSAAARQTAALDAVGFTRLAVRRSPQTWGSLGERNPILTSK